MNEENIDFNLILIPVVTLPRMQLVWLVIFA